MSLNTHSMNGILFDNDGTLVDTHELILESMRYSTKKVLGERISDEALMRKVGQPLAIQMKDFTADPSQQSELLEVYRAHNHQHHDEMVRAFPGIKETLEALADQGVRMGVVTSKMHALAQHGLEITGLAPYFECLVGADDCETFKPQPGPILKGLNELGLTGDHCFYVGDSPFDMQAGRAADCVTVAVTWGMFPLDRLQDEDPVYVCNSPEEILQLR